MMAENDFGGKRWSTHFHHGARHGECDLPHGF